MKTELGTLFFDGSCDFCRKGVGRLSGWLAKRGVAIEPFPLETGAEPPDEMRLRCRDGREFGGADAALVVFGAKWWGKPLAWLGRLPGIHALLVAAYRRVARRRHCIGGACELSFPDEAEGVHAEGAEGAVGRGLRTRREAGAVIVGREGAADAIGPAAVGPEARPYPRKERRPRLTLWLGWLVMGLLSVGAAWAGLALHLENWLRMWLIAAGMWTGFKILALATTAAAGWPRGVAGWLGYALWPGMDAAAFAHRGGRPKIYREAKGRLALTAVLRVLVGMAMVFWLAGKVAHPLAIGWCGMIGMVLILHFGLFDLLALFWRRVGFDVERLMGAPWRAFSLADFWGARWNRAFSTVANRALFRPMTRRFGLAWGTLAGFGLSGVVHELVISVPAAAGYGLPTAYFLLQGAGVLAERKLGWRGTWRGRLLMVVALLGPALWLFHPAFMTEVMVPMLKLLAISG